MSLWSCELDSHSQPRPDKVSIHIDSFRDRDMQTLRRDMDMVSIYELLHYT